MANLKDFFRDLLNWEEQKNYETMDGVLQELGDKAEAIYEDADLKSKQRSLELIHSWPQELRDTIVSAFKNAVSEASVKDSVCPLTPGSSNQSIGNQVEKYIVQKLGRVILGFSISKCRGGGYPDQVLIQQTTGLHIPLEMKATANWDEKDANRRVLTSSSKKLRDQFSGPIYHLLLTALYSKQTEVDLVTIDAIRLDFLEPTTPVSVRLEASVNHKILATGNHYSEII